MQIIQHNRVCSNMQWNNIIGLDLDLLVLDTIVFKWNSFKNCFKLSKTTPKKCFVDEG